MANRNYRSGIGKLLLEVTNVAKETSRGKLDKKPHFVPLDFSSVDLTLGHLIDANKLEKFYTTLLNNINAAGFNTISVTALNGSKIQDIRSKLARGPLAIEYNRKVIGILFSSYSSVGQNLFTPILNKSLAEFSPSNGFDIGHLVSDSLLAKSPLQLKLEEVKGLLDVYAESRNRVKVDKYVANKLALYYLTMYKTNPELVEAELRKKYGYTDIDLSVDKLVVVIGQKLKQGTFQNLKATNQAAFNMVQTKLDEAYNTLMDKSRYGKTIVKADLVKVISPTLAKLRANIVIIQDREENQKVYGARIEAAIDRHVKSDVINTILRSERFSPSFDEGIIEVIRDTVLGKKPKKSQSNKSIKIDASLSQETNITKGKPVRVNKTGTKLPTLRTPTGQFTSITRLENLINSLLTETITKNMQRPNLINQTGRFAKSVQVKSLSQKASSIQIFLTYMKYPYQTFEPGYAQGFRGYDPKRLIDQSVREIATKLVKARLQTVFV